MSTRKKVPCPYCADNPGTMTFTHLSLGEDVPDDTGLEDGVEYDVPCPACKGACFVDPVDFDLPPYEDEDPTA